MLAPWKESYDKHRRCIKKQSHHFPNKGLYIQSCGSSSSYVCIWELDYKEGQVPKNWCFWIVGLEKTLENSLDCKESKLVNSKGNNLNIHWKDYAEAPILWSPDGKSQLTREDPDVGKDWRQEEKGVAED